MQICGPGQQAVARPAPAGQSSSGHSCHAACLSAQQQWHRAARCATQPLACTSATCGSSPVARTAQRPGRHTQHQCRSATTEQSKTADIMQDLQVSKAAAAIIQYALEFARGSETYEVNSWMLLLGILKSEQSTAAKTLRAMGLDDLYGAWHEVLWALNVCDALEPRPFVPEIGFADRAYRVLTGAARFAEWGGRKKVQSEDLLMALAAGAVLEGLFPDINPTFGRVRKAVEQQAGGVYVLPDDEEGKPDDSILDADFL